MYMLCFGYKIVNEYNMIVEDFKSWIRKNENKRLHLKFISNICFKTYGTDVKLMVQKGHVDRNHALKCVDFFSAASSSSSRL